MKIKKYMSYILFGVMILLIILPIIVSMNTKGADNFEEPSETVIVTESETTVATEVTEPEVELISEPLLYPDVGYYEYFSYWDAVDHQDALLWYIGQLQLAINSGLYTEHAIELMIEELSRLELDIMLFQFDIDQFRRWMEEYPVATDVWFYLRNNDFSPEVAAGIIGNMMVECGGGTLSLHPTIYDPSGSFYGLCQWSTYYYPQVRNLELYEQLELLISTIETEFANFGFCYKKNFSHQDFLMLSSPGDAAIAFAKVYERCNSSTYNIRARCAQEAFEYFTVAEVFE